MRVQGNLSPSAVNVEAYAPMAGYAEVRLRENINEISVFDEMSGATVTMFEYDEYVMRVKNRAGLQSEIEANLSEWFATARALELTGGESALVAAQKESEELLNLVGAAVEAQYNADLEVIENV